MDDASADPAPSSASAPWWRRFFSSPDSLALGHFPDEAASRDEALAIAGLLGLRAGDIVGDIPCGPARHLRVWAELGCTAVGLDASPMMLARGRDALASAGAPACLAAGLMQALPFRDGSFDVILSLFNSFGYLAGDDENATVLREVARCLRAGGRFLLDTRNPTVQILCAPYHQRELLPTGVEVTCHSVYSLVTRRMLTTWTAAETGCEVYRADLRLYGLEELTEMMAGAGLRVDAAYGNFAGEPFEGDHAQMILLAAKR
jgi:SAM-dependent methyltransferase